MKPGNLIIRRDGRLVLTDLGIAQMVAADRLTAAGEIVGTSSRRCRPQSWRRPTGPPPGSG